MNPYFIANLLCSLIILCLGLFVLIKNKNSPINLTFFLESACASLWLFGDGLIYQASDKNHALLWAKIAYVGIILLPVFFHHFLVSFLKLEGEKKTLKINYTVSLFFIGLLVSNKLFSELYEFYWGYYAKATAFHTLFLVFFAFVWIKCLLILFFRRKSKKKPIQYILLAFAILTAAFLDFLPAYFIEIHPLSFMFIFTWGIIMAYTIVKHELMDIEVAITHATVFAIVYGFTFGLPFFLFSFFYEQLESLYTIYPLAIPISLMSYAALATISPLVYIKLERKIYYVFFGDYSSQLQVLRETGKAIIEKGFENAKELAELIPLHITRFYDNTMRQKVNQAHYLLRDNGHFILYRGRAANEKSEDDLTIALDNPLVKWFTETRDLLIQNRIIKKRKNCILEKNMLDWAIEYSSSKDALHESHHALISLREEMDKLGCSVMMPSYYKNELLGILALGEKKKGFYRPEELDAFYALAENVAMVFKGAQLTSSVIEEKNINKLERAKAQFFANVSHELRTPLTNIIVPIQKILEEEGNSLTPDNKEEKLVMLKNSFQLLKRINEILDISKLESNKMSIKVSLWDINIILEDLVASSVMTAQQIGIDLRFIPAPALPMIYVEREKIEKVFLNLISNALKFSHSGGVVEITTRDGDNYIEISVKDNGIGISPEALPHIFDRFHQVDGSSSRKYTGTGIGLSLVKEFLNLHNGAVKVHSELNKGTTFTVTLLKGNAHFNPEDIEETPEYKTSDIFGDDLRFPDLMEGKEYSRKKKIKSDLNDTKKKSILVVDDNKDLASNIAQCLEQEYEVFVEYDGKKALEKSFKQPLDLIISDVMMPEMDGYELCEKIKGDERTQHIPFILLTAKATIDDKICSLRHGADEYLTKPFKIKELRAVVESLVTNRELQAQLNKSNLELKKTLQELKQTEAEVIHAEKMKSLGEMLAGFAHEVNNPINYAKNCMYALKEKILDEFNYSEGNPQPNSEKVKKITDLIAFVEEGLDRTINLVTSLNNFSKKDIISFQMTDIHEGINSTIGLLNNVINDMITLHTEFELDEEVECIPGYINQVILNIVRNASQAIEDKGDIWIKTYKENKNAIISIKDNGPGIPEEHLDKIFDPFFTTKDADIGTGLGLSICYKIIKDHHGDILVNNSVGQGAEFIIKFPLRQENIKT
ncbi:MAG: ATP-binding protein [bacterium]